MQIESYLLSVWRKRMAKVVSQSYRVLSFFSKGRHFFTASSMFLKNLPIPQRMKWAVAAEDACIY